MKKLLRFVSVLPLFATINTVSAANKLSVDQYIANYSKSYIALGLGGEMDLSYQKQIGKLLKTKNLAQQQRFLSSLQQQRARLQLVPEQTHASTCQSLQLKQIDFELALLEEKLQLIQRHNALGKNALISEQGIAQSSMGKAWYAFLSKAWLTVESQPEELMALGNAELKRALERYRQLQANMGYAGRDAEFATYLSSAVFQYEGESTPQADYEKRQAIVNQNLHKLFLPNAIQPPKIKPSTLGSALPVDGYYEPEENTFYFNKAKSHYERRNVDWLLLHESTPGHHYQSRYGIEQAACPNKLPHGFYSAYAEGWGAYVEEFGRELGLFQQDADELGAVEWDLVRSIRVILDVGINYYDWNEQQAKEFWQSQLPMLPALADREIKRVRNWPAQAITYKLGAVKFRQLREAEQKRLGDRFDIREFHHSMLKYGPLPLSVLDQVLSTID
jgi:uncharacterized protein (DUF885 family)